MPVRTEVLAWLWGITVEQMRTIAERFGCLGMGGKAVLADLLQERIDAAAS